MNTETNGKVESEVKLRSDIYDVDHSSLTQKVVQFKRQKTTRSLQLTETSRTEGLKVMSGMSKKDIQKFLATRKVKERRPNSQSLLDSQLHRTSDSELYDNDYVDNEEYEEDIDDEELYGK